jgi:tetratricopeptide (TPR) repeat protein
VILQYAFEPYLNLGRLDRIQQKFEEALRKFQVVEKIASGQEAYLGDQFIPAELSREIFSRSTPLPRLMRTAYILEWMKILLKCKQYSEVNAFNPSWHNPADLTARDILWESKIVALCRLGRYDDALAAGNPALSDREGLNRTLFLFRRAETFAAAGRIEDALRVAGNLATGFLNYPGAVSMTRLGLLVRLTVLVAALGMKDALQLAELGYKSASMLGDMLFQSEFLNLMADLRGQDGVALRSEASNIRRNGWYGSARDSSQASAGIIENLTENLLLYSGQD